MTSKTALWLLELPASGTKRQSVNTVPIPCSIRVALGTKNVPSRFERCANAAIDNGSVAAGSQPSLCPRGRHKGNDPRTTRCASSRRFYNSCQLHASRVRSAARLAPKRVESVAFRIISELLRSNYGTEKEREREDRAGEE